MALQPTPSGQYAQPPAKTKPVFRHEPESLRPRKDGIRSSRHFTLVERLKRHFPQRFPNLEAGKPNFSSLEAHHLKLIVFSGGHTRCCRLHFSPPSEQRQKICRKSGNRKFRQPPTLAWDHLFISTITITRGGRPVRIKRRAQLKDHRPRDRESEYLRLFCAPDSLVAGQFLTVFTQYFVRCAISAAVRYSNNGFEGFSSGGSHNLQHARDGERMPTRPAIQPELVHGNTNPPLVSRRPRTGRNRPRLGRAPGSAPPLSLCNQCKHRLEHRVWGKKLSLIVGTIPSEGVKSLI